MTAMVLGIPSGMETLVLLLIALLIFGGSRLANLGKGAGRAVREFREETADLRKKDDAPASSEPVRAETAASTEDLTS